LQFAAHAGLVGVHAGVPSVGLVGAAVAVGGRVDREAGDVTSS
jgi:hypothetical protein